MSAGGGPVSLAETIALGLALGADSLSVSIGIGMVSIRLYRVLKLAMLFSVTQGVLLVGGAKLAMAFHLLLESIYVSHCAFAHTDPLEALHVAFSLVGATILCVVGVSLIRNYIMYRGDRRPVFYKGRAALMLLTLSVSMDAFSSGVGLGISEGEGLVRVGAIVTVVIFVMAFAGLRAGHRIGRVIGRAAEPVGGVALILLAMRFVLGTLH